LSASPGSHAIGRSTGPGESIDDTGNTREPFGYERVIDPSTLASIANQSNIPEDLEVKRQAGLGSVEFVHELAHTSLTLEE
jgi:hypothetical protein